MRLTDVAEVLDSVEDLRNVGLDNGQPAVFVIIFRQPGANIIDAVERVKAELPHLQAAMPSDIDITPRLRPQQHDPRLLARHRMDLGHRGSVWSPSIVFLFLRDMRAAIIPIVAVPVSIVGTFGAMYLLNFSLNNLSLMALTIATGFVVDDAIVVLENISRHLDAGQGRVEAALNGARRSGIYRALDQHLADRGLHSNSFDGRDCRPPVSRIRCHALARHPRLARLVLDHDADDVRNLSQAASDRARRRAPV